MRTNKQFYESIILTALLFAGFSAGGMAQDKSNIVDPETKAPVILATSPADGEVNVNQNSAIEITFSSDMDASSINSTNLLLYATYADTVDKEHGEMRQDQITGNLTNEKSDNSWYYSTGAVNGTLSYANKIAVFTPDKELREGTTYTFTVTNGVKNLDNIALENDYVLGFVTIGKSNKGYSDRQNDQRNGKEPNGKSMYTVSSKMMKGIELGKAGHFVILTKTSVQNKSASKITGHIGEGSVAKSSKKETNKSEPKMQTTSDKNAVLQSDLGNKKSPDVIEAIKDMMFAYSDASLQNGGDSTLHKNESFESVALAPGVHEWSDSLHIASDVTLSGNADDVWIIKVGKNLSVDENIVLTLTEGARADNIFWHVDGEVTIGKNANFKGIILSMNEITLGKGAKLNGRLFSQKSITLDDNTVTEPGSMVGQASSENK